MKGGEDEKESRLSGLNTSFPVAANMAATSTRALAGRHTHAPLVRVDHANCGPLMCLCGMLNEGCQFFLRRMVSEARKMTE